MNPASYLRSNRRFNTLLVLSYMALIFGLSSVPMHEIPHGVGSNSNPLHIIEYAILGFMVYPLLSESKRPLAYAVAFSAIYGLSDEIHQLFVPGRDGCLFDVLNDFVGSVSGAYVSRIMGGR